MRALAGALIAACAAAGAAAQESPPRAAPGPTAPLGKVLEWTSAEGKPYWYRLPRKLDASRPADLLLMLHGTGCKWGWAFWNYPIADGSFRGDDVVVAPEGMTDGGGGTFNFVQGKADREHLAGLIRDLKKRLPIDKVYVYGHSQGAFFAYWFAGEHPELVDGIVAHAGNVLGNVRHPRAAKEKVAVGILHGRADAVVPVDCALASEKVYKEQGYKKLKLMIVEGLDERSGHWPLPKEAAEMLEWLDQVTADSARAAIAVALDEISDDDADLGVVAAAAADAARLMKSAKSDERAGLEERRAAIEALLADVAAKHAAALAESPDAARPDAPFGPWAAHFRIAERHLGSVPAWQAATKELRKKAAAHDKAAGAAIKALGKPSSSAFSTAMKAIDSAFLSTDYDDLVADTRRIAGSPPKGVAPQRVAELEELIGARAEQEASGAEAAAAITREAVARFRADHAAWFE